MFKDINLAGKCFFPGNELGLLKSPLGEVVAADPIGADYGERVIVAFGKAARVAYGGDGDFAFEAAVVGIVDDFEVPNAPADWRTELTRTKSGGTD